MQPGQGPLRSSGQPPVIVIIDVLEIHLAKSLLPTNTWYELTEVMEKMVELYLRVAISGAGILG
jgi:fumarate reductase subunit C